VAREQNDRPIATGEARPSGGHAALQEPHDPRQWSIAQRTERDHAVEPVARQSFIGIALIVLGLPVYYYLTAKGNRIEPREDNGI